MNGSLAHWILRAGGLAVMPLVPVVVVAADRGDVAAVAVDALASALAGRVHRVELTAGLAPPVRRPMGVLQARPIPANAAIGRRMAVWVDAVEGGRVVKSTLVPVEVHAYRPGWVAVRDVPAGQRLEPGQVRQAEVDVAVTGRMPWEGQPEGQVLRRSVLAGKYLTDSQVVAALPVHGGERVQLVSRIGEVEVLAQAEALQDGDVGHPIQVRIAAATGPVPARVVGPGRVEFLP